MARRLPDLHRRPAHALPRTKFWLFCEGENTEPDYFRALSLAFRGSLIAIEADGGIGDPRRIVAAAARKARDIGISKRRRRSPNSFEDRDSVWAIFDHDDHAHFDSAVEQCRSRGIKVARSNPCFEVWLILHVEDYHRPDDSKAVQRHLTNLCLGYDRRGGKSLDCTQLLERIEDAERRAERQLEERAKEGKAFGRPCTTVFQLTRSIRKAALDSVRK